MVDAVASHRGHLWIDLDAGHMETGSGFFEVCPQSARCATDVENGRAARRDELRDVRPGTDIGGVERRHPSLARLRPHRLRADPRQEQTRQVPKREPCRVAPRLHDQLVWAVSPDVLHPLFWVRARQTTQREQPRHKPKFWLAFAGLDELIHLAQRGEVVPSLRRHYPPAPREARQRAGQLAEGNDPVSFTRHRLFSHA